MSFTMLRVLLGVAVLAALAVAETDSTSEFSTDTVRDFWKLRTDTGRAEAYYFALILYPRLTLAYMNWLDPAALPVMLSEFSPLSLNIFGTSVPHLFVAQSFYSAFSAQNWLVTVAFVVSSIKETFREAALAVSASATYFLTRVDRQAQGDTKVWARMFFKPLLRAALWLVVYGSYLRFARPILPENLRNIVFVALATDLAGVFPIKPLKEMRDKFYAAAELQVLGEPPAPATANGAGGFGGSGFGSAGGPNMQFYSFSTGGAGGSFQAQQGNIDLQSLFNQMNEELNRQMQNPQQARAQQQQQQPSLQGNGGDSRFEEVDDSGDAKKED